MKTEHLLIIRFSAMGDVAMAVPVVYALARQYPHLRITMLSRPFARPFFENLAPNVGFMEAEIKGEYRGMKGLNALYRRLMAKHFTLVADFHNILRSNYLRMRFNIDHYTVAHINKHRAGRRLLTAQTNKQLQPQPTSFQNYADVLSELGYPVQLQLPAEEGKTFLSLFPPEGGSLRLLPEAIGEKKLFQQWIGIAPFAAHEGKIYPPEQMEKVVQQLICQHPSCRIFLFGSGEKEGEILHSWVGKYKACTYASALLGDLRKELILMSHLDVMVSMDSANMHLASLVNIPVVSIWGATHPYAGFLGWRQDPANCIQVSMPCRPCSIYGSKPCIHGNYPCLHTITPKTITDRVETILLQK